MITNRKIRLLSIKALLRFLFSILYRFYYFLKKSKQNNENHFAFFLLALTQILRTLINLRLLFPVTKFYLIK
jgi:hypothetical protein